MNTSLSGSPHPVQTAAPFGAERALTNGRAQKIVGLCPSATGTPSPPGLTRLSVPMIVGPLQLLLIGQAPQPRHEAKAQKVTEAEEMLGVAVRVGRMLPGPQDRVVLQEAVQHVQVIPRSEVIARQPIIGEWHREMLIYLPGARTAPLAPGRFFVSSLAHGPSFGPAPAEPWLKAVVVMCDASIVYRPSTVVYGDSGGSPYPPQPLAG
jgi:hypothetical protein